MLRKYSLFVTLVLAMLALGVQTASAQPALSTSRPVGPKGSTLDFENVTSARIQQLAEQSNNEKNVEYGDFDNDGDPDVVVAVALADFSERRNKIYRNDNGVYVELSNTNIVRNQNGTTVFTIGDVTRNAFLRDYDSDGWLDLIIVNDSNNGGGGDPPLAGTTRFFHNKHPGGVFSHFLDETSRLGGASGAACSAISCDNDGDGDHDLYLGNYPFDNQDTYYLNNGNGNFTDVTGSMCPSDNDYTVDVCNADFDGDDQMDILVTASVNDDAYIYYNNLNGAGSGEGDYQYGSQGNGGRDFLGSHSPENSAEPGDFNNDGRMDLYWSNSVGSNDDQVWTNTGNGGDDKANFSKVTMPGIASSTLSHKPTVVDLNDDGRLDVIVMGDNRRPVIWRNTSLDNGTISFVEWAPADVFPNGTSHAGWHTAVFDATGNGRMDMFLGAFNNDYLFENRPAATMKEAQSGYNVPAIHNSSPITLIGNGVNGETDVYDASSIPSGVSVSMVLKSTANVMLQAKNSGGTVVATSDRGGVGVEEAFQFTAPANSTVEVTIVSGAPVKRAYTLEILSRN